MLDRDRLHARGAYERPDIAMRVALTYYSETTHHDVTASETTGSARHPRHSRPRSRSRSCSRVRPASPGTLVFGSPALDRLDRVFHRAPDLYPGVSGGRPLVDYEKDVYTWTIGGARVLNDQWTILGSVTYEAEQDVFSGNLGPTDGRTSIGIGARYHEGHGASPAASTTPGSARPRHRHRTGCWWARNSPASPTTAPIGAGLRVGFSF
jgi:long-chain fatty acid transport protein